MPAVAFGGHLSVSLQKNSTIPGEKLLPVCPSFFAHHQSLPYFSWCTNYLLLKEPYNQYSLLLDRTARKVKWYAQMRFKELGLDMTVDQWLVMKLTDENDELSHKELAGLMYKDMPTVTRIVDILCQKGLIVRVENPADRRVSVLRLTQEGLNRVAATKTQVRSIRLKAWEGLDEKDFAEFNRILNKIYENLT